MKNNSNLFDTFIGLPTQHHSITASQHHSITASQHHSITASQHHSNAASQHNNTTTQLTYLAYSQKY